jgi:DNA-binding CsgD family transcriptional regulator
VDELERAWPDPDRRDEALGRLAGRIATQQERGDLTPTEARVLEARSRGLGNIGAAALLGLSVPAVEAHVKLARRILRAKDTPHACCEALRRGLIR